MGPSLPPQLDSGLGHLSRRMCSQMRGMQAQGPVQLCDGNPGGHLGHCVSAWQVSGIASLLHIWGRQQRARGDIKSQLQCNVPFKAACQSFGGKSRHKPVSQSRVKLPASLISQLKWDFNYILTLLQSSHAALAGAFTC